MFIFVHRNTYSGYRWYFDDLFFFFFTHNLSLFANIDFQIINERGNEHFKVQFNFNYVNNAVII